MSDDDQAIDERLSVFEDEPDLNDWFEVICGSLLAVIGLFQLISPGDLVDVDVMRWFAAAVMVAGIMWAAHGLKDMAIKEVRKSIVLLEMSGRQGSVDHGLIRDVLLNPEAYTDFLVKEYEAAFEDGYLSDEELSELKAIQAALGISDEEAAKLALEGAIKSALADGEVSDDEREMIEKAADTAGLSKAKKTKLAKALDSGEIGTDAKKILESL
jgi:tellurite resistance protein